MLAIIRKLVKATSSSKGAKITISAWLIAVVALSMLTPSAKDYEISSTESSIKEDTPSEISAQILHEQFPTDDGLTALIVFHKENGLDTEDIKQVEVFSEWLQSDDKP